MFTESDNSSMCGKFQWALEMCWFADRGRSQRWYAKCGKGDLLCPQSHFSLDCSSHFDFYWCCQCTSCEIKTLKMGLGRGILFSNEITRESSILAYVPDGSTTATCALDSRTHGLTSSTLLTLPPIMILFDFNLELTVLITTCMIKLNSICMWAIRAWMVLK